MLIDIFENAIKRCIQCNKKIKIPKSNKKYCSVLCGNRYRNRVYKRRHSEKIHKERQRYNADVTKRFCIRIKSRCKKFNIPFDLKPEDIIIPEVCPVLGIKLNFNVGKGAKNWSDSPSIDRIFPEKGYVKGNIRVISNRANLLKSNAEIWELEAVLKDLKNIRGQ